MQGVRKVALQMYLCPFDVGVFLSQMNWDVIGMNRNVVMCWW